eukprot:TRINITY_DN7056_c0_g1_i1.p1 TRINITY_DN7056_c0_g1~~TRINITY_DN7056_c0_g1_i1.p1  ORF type:complete len:927 (+),score=193.35 TRINITY_DN7056_c0_g1_i1:154-2934(+)
MADQPSNELLQQLPNTIQTLYYHPDPNVKRQADVWLRDFQLQPIALGISINLLTTSNILECKFFGASTVLRKIRTQWDSVSNEAQQVLNGILGLLTTTFASGPPVVYKPLCESLAAGGIRAPPAVLTGLIQKLLELSANPASRGMVLDVLGSMCEEIDSAVLSLRRRGEIENTLSQPGLIEQLVALVQNTFKLPSDQAALKVKAANCLAKWIQFGIPLDFFFRNNAAVLECIFSFLPPHQEELSSAAFDVLLGLLQKPIQFTSGKRAQMTRLCFEQPSDPTYCEMIKFVIARLLVIKLDYRTSENKRYRRRICQIIAALGEGHPQMIASAVAAGDSQAKNLLVFLLECTSDPCLDNAGALLEFWSIFEETLHRMGIKGPFAGTFSNLLEILTKGNDFSRQADEDERENFRENSVDVYASVFRVLGPENYVALLGALAEKAVSWEQLETILHALGSVGNQLQTSNDPRLLRIIEMSFNEKMRSSVIASRTHMDFLGHFGSYLKQSPQLLNQALERILGNMHSSDLQLVERSVDAFDEVCRSTGPLLLPSFGLLTSAFEGLKVDFKGQAIESLMQVVSFLPPDQKRAAYGMLHAPLVKRVTDLLQQNTAESYRFLAPELEVLESALKISTAAVVGVDLELNQIWNLIQLAISRSSRFDARIHESLSQVMKQLLRLESLQPKTSEHVLPFLRSVVDIYKSNGCSYYIDVVTAALEHLNQRLQFADSNVAAIFLEISQGSERGFQQGNVEVIESYFKLCLRIVTNYPQAIFKSDSFSAVFHLAVQGLLPQNVDSVRSVVHFLEAVLVVVPSKTAEFTPQLQKVVQDHGQLLIRNYMQALNQSQSRPLVQSELLFHLIAGNPEVLYRWTDAALREMPNEILSEQDRNYFLKVLFAMVNRKDKRRFKSLVKDFNQVCNCQLTPDVLLSYELS